MSPSNQYKIAIIGPADTVSGFRALGVEALDAETGEQALAHLRTIKQKVQQVSAEQRFAVVCVIEELLTDVNPAEYAKVVSGPLPAVVLLPGPAGSSGVALRRLRGLAEQAVGSAII